MTQWERSHYQNYRGGGGGGCGTPPRECPGFGADGGGRRSVGNNKSQRERVTERKSHREKEKEKEKEKERERERERERVHIML